MPKTKIAIFAIFLLSSLFFTSIFSNQVSAHCPLCTAAMVGAVLITRTYGIDDLIVSIFIGGAIISTAYWANNWLKKRHKGMTYLPWQLAILVLATYMSTIYSLMLTKMLGNPMYQIFGIDKLFIGSTLGTLATIFAFWLHDYLRKRNGNKNYLPFQAIVLAFVLMGMAITGFYVLGMIR